MDSRRPILYHDPTSEPSRAVHWFCLAAGVPIDIELVWLTRGEHRSRRLLDVNPRHQVPALDHDGFHLSEATAIMGYLAEVSGRTVPWFGDSAQTRARIQMLLSWYHTNVRLKVTLEYFLPILLMPAYHGGAHAAPETVARLRDGFAETLDQLDSFLADGHYLAGPGVTVPDLLFASELYALDMDPERGLYLGDRRRLERWLEKMRTVEGYVPSHAAWNRVVPIVSERWRDAPGRAFDPAWVADACLEAGE
jgi:glutathione S-transferase